MRTKAKKPKFTYEPSQSSPCTLHFVAWQNNLRNYPGYWELRSIKTGLFWANPAAQELLGYPSEIQKWETALRWVKAEDAIKIEDAHSLTLKTGEVQEFIAQTKVEPYRFTPIANRAMASFCPGCKKHCPTIVVYIETEIPEEDQFSDQG